MGPIIIIKSGTTSIDGDIVKGDFSYFSASTLDLGPTSITGLYSGIDAPDGGYTIYQIGGPNGLNARVAIDTTELNTILITAGATGSTLNDRIIWATNTNSIFVNSGDTPTIYYFGGDFTFVDFISTPRFGSLNTNGSNDTSFNIGTGFNLPVNQMAIQSDGKILVGGSFTTFTGSSQNYLIRLNSDGSKDTSFDIGSGFSNAVRSTAIQSDGKILVGGVFITFTGSTQNRLIRLNSDGSRDTSFNIGTGFNSIVDSIAIQSDGKILAGGVFSTFTGSTQNNLIRLNSDGSKDTSFDIGTGFTGQPFFTIKSIAIQSDGKILVGGNFTTYSGSTQNSLIRLNSDGSKDTSFDIGSGFNSQVISISIQSDGKILVGGSFSTFTGSTQLSLIRLNTDGSKDSTFNIGSGLGTVNSIAIQSDGKVLAGGAFTTFTGTTQNRLIRLNSDGSKDTTFDIGTGFDNTINSIAIKSDGKVLAGGAFTTYRGFTLNRLLKYGSNYSLDTSFNIGTGFVLAVRTVKTQSDGKILAGGDFFQFNGATQNRLIRLNTDGSKDTSFDIGTGFGGGNVFSTAIQSDGKILAGGSFTTFTGSTQNRLIRLNTDGSKDTSFDIGTGFGSSVLLTAIQSDGKILAGGAFTTFTGSTQNRLIRLNTDGSKDTSFDIGTGFGGGSPASISIQSDGKILVGGGFTTFTDTTQNRLIRLNTDGSKDTSFDIGTGFNSSVNSVEIQSNGKIVAGGSFTTFNGINSTYNIVLNSDGSISNNSLTLNSTVNSIAIQQ
jgi:uncharacterized delta-60 repeat protein